MATTSSPRLPAASPHSRWGGARRELTLVRIAILVVGLHVVDDNFLQPQRGTSAGDHLVSGLVPLAALALAARLLELRGPLPQPAAAVRALGDVRAHLCAAVLANDV